MLPPKRWMPERVMWLLIAHMALIVLGIMVVQGYSAALAKEEEKQVVKIPVMLAGTVMYQGVTLVVIGVFLRLHNIGWAEAFGFTTRRLRRTIWLSVLAAAIVL